MGPLKPALTPSRVHLKQATLFAKSQSSTCAHAPMPPPVKANPRNRRIVNRGRAGYIYTRLLSATTTRGFTNLLNGADFDPLSSYLRRVAYSLSFSPFIRARDTRAHRSPLSLPRLRLQNGRVNTRARIYEEEIVEHLARARERSDCSMARAGISGSIYTRISCEIRTTRVRNYRGSV